MFNHWDDFEKRRWRLSALWLVLLAFNILLHMDFMEEWADELQKITPYEELVQLKCSSIKQYTSNKKDPWVFSSLNEKPILTQEIKDGGAHFQVSFSWPGLQDLFKKQQQIFSQLILTRITESPSGLSPPLS